MSRVALSSIASIHGGGRHKASGKDFVETGTPAFGAGGLNGRLPFSEGTEPVLIVGTVGTCGRCYDTGGPWVSLANTQVLHVDTEVVDRRFLWYQLDDPASWPLSGTSQKFIKPSDVKNRQVWLPPLAEQRRISTILDRASSICERRAEVLRRLDDLESAIFEDLCPAGRWPESELNDVARTSSGGTPNRSVAENYGGTIPWVKSGELHAGLVTATAESITELGLKSSSAKLLPAGTVLIAMYGATAGVVGQLAVDAATNQAVCAISPGPTLTNSYVAAFLRSQTQALLNRRTGGAQPNLSQGTIRSLRIPVPPLPEQRAFDEQMAAVARMREVTRRALHLDHGLLSASRRRAFRGEL